MKKGWKIALGAVGIGTAAAAVTTAASVGTAYNTLHRLRRQKPMLPASPWDEYGKIIERHAKQLIAEYPPEHITITSSDGLKLHAQLFTPPDADKLAICVHGYHSNGFNDFGGGIALYYVQRGWRVLLVDDRAHGDSEGEFIGFGTLDRDDVLQWLRYSAIRFGANCPMVLHGMSMGAATVLMATGLELPGNVKAVVADCGFSSAWEQFQHVLRQKYHLPPFPVLAIADAWASRKAGYGLRQCNAAEELKKATVPVLFIHGAADTFVPAWMTEKNYDACPTFKMKWICPEAGHAESWFRDEEQYCNTLNEFFAAVMEK